MLANLDLLLMTVFCPADDLLPERAKNARRGLGLRDTCERRRIALLLGPRPHEAEAVRVARELLDMVAVLRRTIGAAA